MKTLLLSAADPITAPTAANLIRKGELVAIPTETVYGLGANGLDEAAVAKIFEAKGRPQDNPLILHICGPEQIALFCHSIPEQAYALAERFWPGPLTMVLPARDVVPKRTTGGLDTVAVRCPDSDITRQIIRLAGVPLAAPSANISGKPSTTTAEHVRHDHNGRIAAIVDGGSCRVGVESTIVDLTGDRPRLLRPGGVTPEELLEVLGDLVVDKAVTASISNDTVVKAPGMKYRHYAPGCPVIIVSGSREKAARYIHAHRQSGDRVLCFEEELPLYEGCNPLPYGREDDVETLSAGLFAALRELDDPHVNRVFARCPEGGGVAYAVQNRLKKAAAFHVVDAEDFPTVIGITGGSGCGKTTALRELEKMGALILDCDAVYHRLTEESAALRQALCERFGEVYRDGKLERKALGRIVFADEQALSDLNAITHRFVDEECERLMEEHAMAGGTLAALDAVALCESGMNKKCAFTFGVLADREKRIERIMARDGITADYAALRIDAQQKDEYYKENCTHLLYNNGTPEEFKASCRSLFRQLL